MPGKEITGDDAMQEDLEDDGPEMDVFTVTKIAIQDLPMTYEQIKSAIDELAQ